MTRAAEPRPFLTARWEHLLMLNYAVQEEILEPLVPRGTELDRWQGEPLVSLIGFRFLGTRICGIPIPGHRDFTEVNLRFYVRRRVQGEEDRRGVVFIRELVSRAAITAIARLAYNEPYLTLPMSHEVDVSPDSGGNLAYGWSVGGGGRSTLRGRVEGPACPIEPGSVSEFVTQHFWGYTRQRDGGTLEYRVEHPRWRGWVPAEASYAVPVGASSGTAFGASFDTLLAGRPHSSILALGSPVTVFRGRRIPA